MKFKYKQNKRWKQSVQREKEEPFQYDRIKTLLSLCTFVLFIILLLFDFLDFIVTIIISTVLSLRFERTVSQCQDRLTLPPRWSYCRRVMESHDEMGCQAPERPILCVNNCGFFGREATMNMCSKCYKDTLLKQEQEKLVATSVENIVNGNSSSNGKLAVTASAVDVRVESVELNTVSPEVPENPISNESVEMKAKTGPSRCATCRKRVGLTGFSCKCGNLFCSMHRYSDKHDCPFDYRTAGQKAIAESNPVIKADKLDKI